MLHRIGAALVVLLALACVSPEAWAGKVGPEFRVNTYKTNHQQRSSVAKLSNDGFVVIWDSLEQDGSSYGVYGQRYSAAGAKVGSEFRVNTHTADVQAYPCVAALGNGGFVVTWSSYLQDGSSYGVYGQRYSAAGARAGDEFRVNTETADIQYSPSVAGLGNGGFVVTWHSYLQDGSNYGVYGQRYSAAGVPAGDEFQVNTETADGQASPSVAALGNGGFVVTWHSSSSGVFGQRYSAAGAPVGGEFRVSTATAAAQIFTSVAGLGNGGFVVTWQSYGQDGSLYGIYGQRYRAAGARAGGEFRVNTYTTNDQRFTSVAALGNGGFVVTWQSNGQDGSVDGVYGQRYSAAGARVGGEFRVNTATASWQEGPSVAGLSNGDFVVTWSSYGQDGASYGVYGQRYNFP
jgi:acyl dehydratase